MRDTIREKVEEMRHLENTMQRFVVSQVKSICRLKVRQSLVVDVIE